MVATLGSSPAPTPRDHALHATIERLKRGPILSQAQREALAHLQGAGKTARNGPKQASANRVASLKAKLAALKMAAAAAAATGDLKLARAAIRDMRALAKDLAAALRDAGLSKGAATLAAPRVPAPPPMAAPDAIGAAEDRPDEIDVAAADVVRTLHKILGKLRQALAAAHMRGADAKEIAAVEKDLRDGEKDLAAAARRLGGGAPSVEIDA